MRPLDVRVQQDGRNTRVDLDPCALTQVDRTGALQVRLDGPIEWRSAA
jgi:hypothetical protein